MEIQNDKFDNSIKQILDCLGELRSLLQAKNRLNNEVVLDNQDMCILLKISKRSLQRYRSQELLPYFTIGGKIYYLESEVEKFIDEHIKKNP